MTADALTSILEAQVQTGALLVETLDRQRAALVERDLERLLEITETLEEQVRDFGALVEARTEALADAPAQPADEHAGLLRRIRRTEARVMRLTRLNQELLADRLAYVGAMLSTVGLAGATGYGAEPRMGALSRSA